MKKLFLYWLAFFSLYSCKTQSVTVVNQGDLAGIYVQHNSTSKLKLESDGSFTLCNPENGGHLAVDQCPYASKGKWRTLSNDVLEITSENYYSAQRGFEYELNKENKFSPDSLYITINLPADLIAAKGNDAVDFLVVFNSSVSKSIASRKNIIVLPKSKYLADRKINTNSIALILNARITETTLYRGRIMFEIFEDYVDTEKYNYLTFDLPNFDLCFFEFEPYNHALIFIKSKNKLVWQGQVWEK